MTKQRVNVDKVLVLGNDPRVMLAIIRSLGRQNVQVHVGWCPEDSPVLSSRYIHEVHTIPDFHATDDSWKRTLIDLIRDGDFDLVIPSNDPAVVPLQIHRAEFEPWAPLCLLDDDVFRIVFDKVHTSQLASDLGIPVPLGVVGSDLDTLIAKCKSFRFPLYVKPRSSVTENDVLNKRVVKEISCGSELRKLAATVTLSDEVIVQESFEGEGVGVEVLANRGDVCSAMQHRRLHESLAGGSTYRETMPLNSQLFAATAKLMRALNYTGVAMVEFRVNPQSGNWALLEINARFWGSLPLAIAAGMDFPYQMVEMCLRGKKRFDPRYRSGVACRNLIEDLRWMKNNTVTGIWNCHKVLPDLAKIVTGIDHLDMFALDDWRPQAKEISDLIRAALHKISRRQLTRESYRQETSERATSSAADLGTPAVCDQDLELSVGSQQVSDIQ